MNSTAKISCRHLWKVFGPDPLGFLKRHDFAPGNDDFKAEKAIGAVRDVSFDVMSGEILIIMGLSGSGKSTLIRAITRLNDPTSGEVLLDGKDLLKCKPEELIDLRRHKMGMVFQHFGLLPHRNVLSNVAFPLEVSGSSRDEREARAREMIKLVGLEGRESYFPRELSGGQQQRVGIARSLAVGPDIWFLDEPFSALDPLIRADLQAEVLRLQQTQTRTVVFVTHDLDEAIRLADRIAIMEAGRIIQIGTPEELVMQPATDYVRRFVAKVPPARVVRVSSIMTAEPGTLTSGVNVNATIAEIAPELVAAEGPLPVLDNGRQIGWLDRSKALTTLAARA